MGKLENKPTNSSQNTEQEDWLDKAVRSALNKAARKARDSKRGNTIVRFAKSLDLVLDGLRGSGMRMWDCWRIIENMETAEDALPLMEWMYRKIQETGEYPTPAETLTRAGLSPSM